MALWIVVETPLVRNFKVRRLARTLSIQVPQAVGHLIALWSTVLEQRDDGDITRWTPGDIEDYALWDGEPGALSIALQSEDHRFIDAQDNNLLIHDWLETAGKYLINKYAGRNGNRKRLVEIWAKHGKVYGAADSTGSPPGEPLPPPAQDKYTPDSLEIKISQYLFKKIREHHPNRAEPKYQEWAKEIDAMLRLDELVDEKAQCKRQITKDDIRAIIDWTQTHVSGTFSWRDNILSTKKLRAKFQTMWHQMEMDNERKAKEADRIANPKPGLHSKGRYAGVDKSKLPGLTAAAQHEFN